MICISAFQGFFASTLTWRTLKQDKMARSYLSSWVGYPISRKLQLSRRWPWILLGSQLLCVFLYLFLSTLAVKHNSVEGETWAKGQRPIVPERVIWNQTSNNTWEVDFPPEHVWGKDSIAVVNDPAGGKENVLRVHFTKKHYWGSADNPVGGGFLYPPIPPQTAMLMSFDIYFSSNFDFSKGGKLPGLWGGSMDACGGGSYTEDCFTLRFIWREGAVGGIFAHLPRDQSPDFCDRPDVMCETSWGLGLGRGTWTFKKSRWQRISMYVKLNIPGHQDGYIKVFVDDKVVYEARDISLRVKYSVMIVGMFFHTMSLGAHDSDLGATQSCYMYYRNFFFSRDRKPPPLSAS